MLEHFLFKKLHNRNVTLDVRAPLPDPYTTPCESFTVGSIAAGRLLTAYPRTPSLLPSLHQRTLIWFLLTQT